MGHRFTGPATMELVNLLRHTLPIALLLLLAWVRTQREHLYARTTKVSHRNMRGAR